MINIDVRKGWCACSASTRRMREEKERRKRWDRTTSFGSACSGSDNCPTDSLMVNLVKPLHFIVCASPWTLETFRGLHFQNYIAGKFASAVGPSLSTQKKKRRKINQGAGAEPTGFGSLVWDATTVLWWERGQRGQRGQRGCGGGGGGVKGGRMGGGTPICFLYGDVPLDRVSFSGYTISDFCVINKVLTANLLLSSPSTT